MERAIFTKAAKTGMIKRGYVTEGRRNSRDLNYLILALLTKTRETGEIPITSKKQKNKYVTTPLKMQGFCSARASQELIRAHVEALLRPPPEAPDPRKLGPERETLRPFPKPPLGA